jgi:hypothetical protein
MHPPLAFLVALHERVGGGEGGGGGGVSSRLLYE